MSDVAFIIASIEAILEEEDSVSKAVKSCLEGVIAVLKSDGDVSLKKDKCMVELDTLANNDYLDSYMRTQIWDIVALVEQL